MKIIRGNKNTVALTYLCMFMEGAAYMLLASTKEMVAGFYGIDMTKIGLLLTIRSISSVLFLFFTGALSDKIGRKPLILLGTALFSIHFLLTPMFDSFILGCILIVIFGLAYALTDPSSQALLFDCFDDATPAMPFVQVAFGLGGIVVPLIVSFTISNEISWKFVYFLFAAVALGVFIFAYFRNYPKIEKHESRSVFKFKIKPSIKIEGLIIFLMIFFAGPTSAIAMNWADVYVREIFNFGMSQSKAVLSVYQIGSIMGALLFSIVLRKKPSPKVLSVTTIISLAFFLIAFFAPNATIFIIGLVVCGLFGGSLFSIGVGYAGSLFYENSGAATAAMGISTSLSYALASFISGLLVDSGGVKIIFASLIVTMSLAAILAQMSYKRFKTIVIQ